MCVIIIAILLIPLNVIESNCRKCGLIANMPEVPPLSHNYDSGVWRGAHFWNLWYKFVQSLSQGVFNLASPIPSDTGTCRWKYGVGSLSGELLNLVFLLGATEGVFHGISHGINVG